MLPSNGKTWPVNFTMFPALKFKVKLKPGKDEDNTNRGENKGAEGGSFGGGFFMEPMEVPQLSIWNLHSKF